MMKNNTIFKLFIIVIISTFFFVNRADALSVLKFIGNETEIEKISVIENISDEFAMKTRIESLINDSSVNIRWNAAKMLSDIGDDQSLKLLQIQITRETDRLAKDQEIQAIYAIKFRLAVLSGGNPENELLEFFSSGYYPLRSGMTSRESYGSAVYAINQLALIGSSTVRSYIGQILDLSNTQDLGLLPETCNRSIYILDNYRIPQKYVVALKTGDLGLKYWAAKELRKRAKTEVLTADNKTVIDLLKAQLFFAQNNGYEDYYNYINDILKNTFRETVSYVEPQSVYENKPPVITQIPDKSIYEGKSLTIKITADDPDGGLPKLVPYITIKPLPEGATLQSNVFHWTPEINQEGSYRTTIFAQDESGSVSSVSFNINVLGLAPESVLKNTGNTALSGYLLMKVQKLIDSNSWQDYRLVAIDGASRTIQPGETVNLKHILNIRNYIAEEAGSFRIYASFLNEQGDVLFSDTDEFEVLASQEEVLIPISSLSQEKTTIEKIKQKIAITQQRIIQLLSQLIQILR